MKKKIIDKQYKCFKEIKYLNIKQLKYLFSKTITQRKFITKQNMKAQKTWKSQFILYIREIRVYLNKNKYKEKLLSKIKITKNFRNNFFCL